MRDLGYDGGSGSAATVTAVLPSPAEIASFAEELAGWSRGLDDVERIDSIRALEILKCAAEGAQAVLAADFDISQRALAAAAGEPAERQGRGIAAQVALARRESPHKGQRHLGLAKVLATEMPHTREALRSGRITEWRATLLARETACLTLEDRRHVDQAIAGDPDRVEAMGDRELVGEVAKLAARLDPASVAERRRRAEADRHTTLRPTPDVMTWFGALLPVKDGVAVHAALVKEADRATAAGDPRSRGAIMADTLVARVLAPHIAEAIDNDTRGDGTTRADVPLVINVVVSDSVLFGDSEGAGFVQGYGEVPGDLLREWITDHAGTPEGARVQDWVRRLYCRPSTGDLVAMGQEGPPPRRCPGRLPQAA